jgi:eukaryotic-like serine/threonine-protein kinase
LNATAAPPKICPTCGGRFAADALFCPDDGTPLSSAGGTGDSRTSEAPDPYLGREISGHIEIRQLAGIGAMGRVYRAFQRGIERDVAVKVLHRELSANPQLVARFHREAKVASRLSHPNVVQVHLAGQLPDGALYIVMEYLDGMSLQSALAAAGGHMPLARAMHIGLQICDAAGEAHALGVVHRDLKPENVMLVRRGDDADYVKVLDFGIARLNWGDQSMSTAAGLIFGTARYISPEGAQGETVGPPGDVYAIATLLYQMLSGRTPFEGDQAVALLVQQIHDIPPPLKSIPRGALVPEPIASVVMRNLAKRAGDRASEARILGRMLVDAAKASGLSPEELVPRSALLGSRPGIVQLPPQQRTKQIELPPELAARLAAGPPQGTVRIEPTAPPGSLGSPQRDARPSQAADSPQGSAKPPPVAAAGPAPGAATTKWSPPADLQARLAAKPAAEPMAAPRKRVDSNVDRTMDDADALPAMAPTPAPQAAARLASVPAPTPAAPRAVVRTEFGEPAYLPGANPPTPPPAPAFAPVPGLAPARAPSPTPAPAPELAPSPEPSAPALAPGGLPPPTVPSRPNVVTKPPSNVESTLSDEESALAPRRARARAAVIIILFFVVSVLATAGVYRMGWFGLGTQKVSTLDAEVDRANDAMRHKRWDSPAGDNVRDLTDDGLTRWPRDARLLDIRERAADELVKEALDRKFDGDLPKALHLARLANQLDPTDQAAQHLVEEYQQAEKAPPADLLPMTGTDAGTTPSRPGTARPTGPGPLPTLLPTAKVAIDAAPAHPRVGQPVGFIAKVTNSQGATPKVVEEVHFKLNGPGLTPDTRLSPIADAPGTYKSAFTFFEAGKYELTFEARVDGVLIRTVRQVVAGDDATPQPPPTPSGKWL